MIIIRKEASLGTLPIRSPRSLHNIWRNWARIRLNAAFGAAREVPFDNDSKIIFFSDLHRGDNSKSDAFARNEDLFLNALTHYYREGFTYIEVGDGDEVWKNPCFDDIVGAHQRTFDLLHVFDRQNRLHLIYGNHDLNGHRSGSVEKDGILAEEGLVLRHSYTGQRLFAVHGHQADFKSDALSVLSRLAVRHVWRRLQLVGVESALRRIGRFQKNGRVHTQPATQDSRLHQWMLSLDHSVRNTERRIMNWAEAQQQVVICGHTHRPSAARCSAPHYFNTGSCTRPGFITGLELQNGQLQLVKWTRSPNGGAPGAERQLLAHPTMLRRFV